MGVECNTPVHVAILVDACMSPVAVPGGGGGGGVVVGVVVVVVVVV